MSESIQAYDSIVILGSRPLNPKTWELPSHVYASLDRAAELYNAQATGFITVSGEWTINFDVLNIKQPFKECDAMAEYLQALDIPDEAILREAVSKDTISNLYYLKRQIFEPKAAKNLLFIAAEPRLERIKFLCKRILGPDYFIACEGVGLFPDEAYSNEAFTLKTQSEFLEPMRDSDDSWLDGKFYDDPFYEAVRIRVEADAANEPFLQLAG